MKALICEFILTCMLAAPGARNPEDLAYGTMLYAYHQQDYQQALVDVLVAEARGQTGAEPVRFALAKGSFAFAEGLSRWSVETFAEIDPGSMEEIDRLRLAFHRARAHHQAGEWSAMQSELDLIPAHRGFFGGPRQHPEVGFMRAEAALAAGALTGAEAALELIPRRSDYQGYALFNLAVAQRAAGDLAGARTSLARLADLSLRSPAGRDLVARGRLGLAVLAREADQPLDAESILANLPADARYREQALAVYGDLAMDREDYRLAARIWLTLEADQDWHAGRAAAALGLPMALEALASPAHALDGYRRAAGAFEQRLGALRTLRVRAQDPAWAGHLALAHAEDDDARIGAGLPELNEAFGARSWLAWLADEQLHALLEEWRELHAMRQWLDELPDNLQALEGVKTERQRRSRVARETLAAESLATRRDDLTAEVAALEATLGGLADPARKLDDQVIAALASATEQRQLARLGRLSTRLETLGDPSARAGLARRIARLEGVVVWDIAETRSERVRALQRELDSARTQLADADQRLERLARAEAELEAGVAVDFRALAQRAAQLERQVAANLAARERAIAERLGETVEEEIRLTEGHLLAARTAIARTTDQLAADVRIAEPGT